MLWKESNLVRLCCLCCLSFPPRCCPDVFFMGICLIFPGLDRGFSEQFYGYRFWPRWVFFSLPHLQQFYETKQTHERLFVCLTTCDNYPSFLKVFVSWAAADMKQILRSTVSNGSAAVRHMSVTLFFFVQVGYLCAFVSIVCFYSLFCHRGVYSQTGKSFLWINFRDLLTLFLEFQIFLWFNNWKFCNFWRRDPFIKSLNIYKTLIII